MNKDVSKIMSVKNEDDTLGLCYFFKMGEKERQKALDEYSAILSFVLGEGKDSYLSEIE